MTHNLITRLWHNVIRSGLRYISISYSRILLVDVARKLRLDLKDPVVDAEIILVKAIRDGAIDSTIDHVNRWMVSKETRSSTRLMSPSSWRRRMLKSCIKSSRCKAMPTTEREAKSVRKSNSLHKTNTAQETNLALKVNPVDEAKPMCKFNSVYEAKPARKVMPTRKAKPEHEDEPKCKVNSWPHVEISKHEANAQPCIKYLKHKGKTSVKDTGDTEC